MIGWKLRASERLSLLELLPVQFDDIIADHITYSSGNDFANLLPELRTAFIIGHSSDNLGVQAMIIKINESIFRPDGKIFHITWSLDLSSNRRPAESNHVIMENGWNRFESIIEIKGLYAAKF